MTRIEAARREIGMGRADLLSSDVAEALLECANAAIAETNVHQCAPDPGYEDCACRTSPLALAVARLCQPADA